MKIAKLITLALAAGTLAVSAATYQVSGTLGTSSVPGLATGSTVTFTFDYNPALAGTDYNSSPNVGMYLSGLSNMSVKVGSGAAATVAPQSLIIANWIPSINGAGDEFAPQFSGLNLPGVTMPFSYGEFRFKSDEFRWPGDAAPTDITSTWNRGGSFRLTYMEEDPFMPWMGMDVSVQGTLDMNTLQNVSAIPEPSAALLLGAAGSTLLLRRRRSRC